MLQRLLRKIRYTTRYPHLAVSRSGKKDLWVFGLKRNRLLPEWLAALLTGSGSLQIQPRLAKTCGQPVRVDMGLTSQIDCFDELFFDDIYDLAAVNFTPDLVVDCGAFCGYFSAMAAGWFPGSKIICFEANPENLPALKQQLALLSNPVELHAAAVSVQEGTVSFSGHGVGGSIHTGEESSSSHKIACIHFPLWLEKQVSSRLVWKLDVEGAEREILPATLPYLPQQCVCFLETHYPDDLCRKLLDPYCHAGFSLREIRRRPAVGFDYVEWILIRQ